MKVAIPVAQYHQGNTSDYVKRALESLGHSAEIISPQVFSEAFYRDEYDLFFGVDSGEPFPFTAKLLDHPNISKLAFWFIDYRHNKNRANRNPNDESNAKLLSEKGATIFQAQFEDYQECKAIGIERVYWLPMAADLEIWSNLPLVKEKRYDVGFVGNVWDRGRAEALQLILNSGLRFGFLGHGKIWMERAAALLRESLLGFNISSFYGEPVAFDVNMRFFETLSCGLPIVTNEVPSLYRLFDELPRFIKVYRSKSEIIPILKSALSDADFISSGEDARKWVTENGTYQSRMHEVLKIMSLDR